MKNKSDLIREAMVVAGGGVPTGIRWRMAHRGGEEVQMEKLKILIGFWYKGSKERKNIPVKLSVAEAQQLVDLLKSVGNVESIDITGVIIK